jgi:anti-sigma factor RsiW
MRTACRTAAPLVTAYIDGELAGEERSAFEAHVGGCRQCRQRLDEERAVVAAVRGSLPLYGAPDPLRDRVERLLERAPRGRRRLSPPWAWVAAGLAGAALAGAAVVRSARAPAPPAAWSAAEFAAVAVDTHLRYARRQLPLDVASDRADVVSAWFAGRLPFHLALPDYPLGPGERKPYRLEGGRLVSFRGEDTAYVAYRMDEEPVSLLVTSSDRVRPAGGEIVRSGALEFHVESVAGLNLITWSHQGLTYALASDVAVPGTRSCLVCHGSAAERRRLEPLDGV